MTIGYAVQKGTLIYIYDADGRQITSVSAPGRWPDDGLKGFSTSTIHIQKGTLLYAYDEHGHQTGLPTPVKQGNIEYIQSARRQAQKAAEYSPRFAKEAMEAISA